MTVHSAYRASVPDIAAKPTQVVLIGGSGHVGRLLAGHFHGQGIGVSVVTRTTFCSPWRVVVWDGTHLGPWVRALEGADVVINLAGRSVDCRYHRANRREILDSRVR